VGIGRFSFSSDGESTSWGGRGIEHVPPSFALTPPTPVIYGRLLATGTNQGGYIIMESVHYA
jgi:hypothetical protein